MTYKEQNRIVLLTYVVGIVANLLLDCLIRGLPTAGSVIGSIKTTTVLTAWWGFYFYCGWRLPYLRKILYRMDYNGTWFGTYESISAESDHHTGEIAVRIQQSYLTISIISLTEKYQNYSYSELVKFDEKSKSYGISYTYSQQENNLFDVSRRNGTCEMALKTIDGEPWLDGTFWTIHGTKGTLRVKRVSKERIDTFAEAKKRAGGVS